MPRRSGKTSIQEAVNNLNTRLTTLEGLLSHEGYPTDPKRVGYSREATTRDNGAYLDIGRIVDTAPLLNGYKVQVPNSGIIVCSCLSMSGGMLYMSPNYAPGDTVLVVMSKVSKNGMILGRLPLMSQYGKHDMRSFITMSDAFKPDIFQKSFLDTLPTGKNYIKGYKN